MKTEKPLLQTVLGLPPSEVNAWLEGHVVGQPVGGQFFSWHLFAEAAASRANEERSLTWAHLSLYVYENLASQSSGDTALSFTYSSMNLRARMIMEFGAREGDALLDPEFIAVWARQLITLSQEEALRVSSSPQEWGRDISPARMLEIRWIKHALTVIELISASGVLQKHPELESWLHIKHRLL